MIDDDVTIITKRGTAEEWAAHDDVLAEGELGILIQEPPVADVLKAGDGRTPFSLLEAVSGERGPIGEDGPPGADSYAVWLEQGNTGTPAEFLEAYRGPKGEQGDPGPSNAQVATYFQGMGPTLDAADALYRISMIGSPNRLAAAALSGGGGYLIDGLGTDDDGAVINAAIAATASFVRAWALPADIVCKIATGISIPAGKILRGATSTILRKSAGAGQIVFTNQGSTLEGVTLDGNGLVAYCSSANGSDATYSRVTFTGSTAYGMNCLSDRVTVDQCRFLDLPSYGCLFNIGTGHRITNNYVSGGQGFHLGTNSGAGASDSVIANNIIKLTTGVGIEVFGTSARRVAVTGNFVSGGIIGISLAAVTACTVTGNVVTGAAQIGIENAEGASGNAIVGNTVWGGAGSGIQITTSNDATKPLRNVVVANNAVTGCAGEGIGIASGKRILVVGNIISNAGGTGINLRTQPSMCVVENNIVSTTDTVPAPAPAGITITGSGHTVAGNRVDQSERSVVAQGSGIVFVGGGDHFVTRNRIDKTRFGIELNGCGTTILDDNRTVGTSTWAIATYNAGSATSIVYRHFSRLAGGGVTNTDANAASYTGPFVTV